MLDAAPETMAKKISDSARTLIVDTMDSSSRGTFATASTWGCEAFGFTAQLSYSLYLR